MVSIVTLMSRNSLKDKEYRPCPYTHSTRGASTSAAARTGISLPEIIKLGDWTKDSTFKRFYYRPVWNATVGRSILHNASVG
jgi:hypothetical protein